MAYPQTSFCQTTLIPGSLIAQRRDVVSSKTLPYQLQVLKETGRYEAFKLQWHRSYSDPPDVWPIPNHLFWDSDIGKWIEGACYLLHGNPNPQLDSAIAELTEMIRSAQQPDGYINIHYTVVEPGKRFTNLRDFHELYNAGHLIEAGLAHNQLYQNDQLLAPILKYVDLICRTFGPGENQKHGYPGHPEIELALLRLYDRTKDRKHFELAKYFITERGSLRDGQHYYRQEAQAREEASHVRMAYWGEADALWYYQAHKPIVEQQTIKGHSVRAMYLLTAAADVVRSDETSDPRLHDAIYRLWDNMVECKMYVTGGIGAMKQWEGFGLNYFLPQGTDEGGCYAETCAAIGVMMLAERILQFDLDHRFSDIMELCLYNAVLTAMSHDGTKFTYVNQLASSDVDLSKREEWFTCACCPPNVLRLLGQIGGYIYSHQEQQKRINVHLYVSSEHRFVSAGRPGILRQKSNWPWKGQIDFEIEGASPEVSVALRIPAWAKSWKISPEPPNFTIEKGYLILPAKWICTIQKFELFIDLATRLVTPHPFTNQDTVTLIRGPVVYCVEDVDNTWVKDHFKSVQIDPHCLVEEEEVKCAITGDEYVSLKVVNGAKKVNIDRTIYRPAAEVSTIDSTKACGGDIIGVLRFIPYFFRANRAGRGQSRVGLRILHKSK